MATKESSWAEEIISVLPLPRQNLAAPDALLSTAVFSAWMPLPCAHDEPYPRAGQSTQSTAAVNHAGILCRINQQYLFPIPMTPAYHWPRRLQLPEWHLFTST